MPPHAVVRCPPELRRGLIDHNSSGDSNITPIPAPPFDVIPSLTLQSTGPSTSVNTVPGMLSSSLAHTPLTRALIAYLVTSAVVVSLADVKPYLGLDIPTHLFAYGQIWRVATWWAAYTSSTDVLLAVAVVYQLRVVERLWGTRKLAVSRDSSRDE